VVSKTDIFLTIFSHNFATVAMFGLFLLFMLVDYSTVNCDDSAYSLGSVWRLRIVWQCAGP